MTEATETRTGAKETFQFQTEVRRLLDLMIHSLYSNREIFLRELISNGSDAADKLRFEAATDDSLYEGDADLHLEISVDKEAKTITVRDNGIGMDREEVIDNIGTIARSGTRAFCERLSGDARADSQLIGQFGVGFYSAFLVADEVTLTTRRAGMGHEHGVRWQSRGDGDYTLERVDCPARGTEVVLHLRDDAAEFLDDYRLRSIVHKYADHIPFPIRMPHSDEKKRKKGEWETVNQASALWTRPKSELSDEEYRNFYKHVSHGFDEPLTWLHQHLEGKYEYTLLFYIPEHAPFDLWHAEAKSRVKLYVQRVFIMEAGEELLPRWLRFVSGVIDSSDLPLNVSREILQQNPAMEAIKSGATRRMLGHLETLAEKDPERYARFWGEFGTCLKEGVVEDFANRERIAALLRFSTTESDEERVSLADYIGRMKEGQEEIYFITAETLDAARHSPHLEIFRKKGIEVLLLHDRIDEWLVQHLTEFDGKQLKSIAKGELDLSKIAGGETAAEQKEKEARTRALRDRIKQALGDRVKDVRISNRLTESPACLISDQFDISANLERILKRAGQKTPEVKPILEINPDHPLIVRLNLQLDQCDIESWARILMDQAILAEGALPEDPAGFVRRVNEMLAR
ncbi:MAG: molecular chaperone HtpG [Zetaproteobacteria bacterium]|nr:MAG: molecular chaperone HtpG [Zetaproteobacteria bacterium]